MPMIQLLTQCDKNFRRDIRTRRIGNVELLNLKFIAQRGLEQASSFIIKYDQITAQLRYLLF